MQWRIQKIWRSNFYYFSLFHTSWLAWNLLRLYIVAPFTSHILLLMKRSHVISIMLSYTLEYSLFTWLSFTICIVFNTLFRYITLCTYGRKNIVNNWHYIQCVPWTWWTLASFLMSGCSVVSKKIISCHIVKVVIHIWEQISHPPETRFNQIRCGKSNKIQLFFVGEAGENGSFASIWNLQYL
jgi:hypothetical protein